MSKSNIRAWLDNKRKCEAQGKPNGTSALGIPSCGDHGSTPYKSFEEWVKIRESIKPDDDLFNDLPSPKPVDDTFPTDFDPTNISHQRRAILANKKMGLGKITDYKGHEDLREKKAKKV